MFVCALREVFLFPFVPACLASSPKCILAFVPRSFLPVTPPDARLQLLSTGLAAARHGVVEWRRRTTRISDPPGGRGRTDKREQTARHTVPDQQVKSEVDLSYILNAAGKFMQNATDRERENVRPSVRLKGALNSLPSVRMRTKRRREGDQT